MTDADALDLLAYEALALAEAARTPPAHYHGPVEQLLAESLATGVGMLCGITRTAVRRLLSGHIAYLGGTAALFTPDERQILAGELARVQASALLVGRTLVAEQGERVRRKHQAREALEPRQALDFFSSLKLILGTDPLRVLPDLRRTTFTLVVAAERTLLEKVRDTILERMRTGQAATGKAAVQACLDAAGVSPRQPHYAELVWRTNTIDAYNQGVQQQITAEAETFPVWMYSNPADDRSRPTHAARNRKYYPTSVPFTQVRGTAAEDVIQCRCGQIPIDRWTWSELREKGARIADGYQDVAA